MEIICCAEPGGLLTRELSHKMALGVVGVGAGQAGLSKACACNRENWV